MKAMLSLVIRAVPVICALSLTACTLTRPSASVQSNDKVRVHYSCRSADGLLITTTDKAVAEDPETPKSPIFEMPDDFGPIIMDAGQTDPLADSQQELIRTKGFSEVLHEQIAASICGLVYDRTQPVQIKSAVPEGLSSEKRYVSFAKVWERPKQSIITVEQFIKMKGMAPVVGFQYMQYMGIQATVAQVRNGRVLIRYAPVVEPGGRVPTQFGEGIIRDGRGSWWEIEMQVIEGQVVRNGDLVGRVVEVRPNVFYVDYGHPFGGMELVCDVLVDEIKSN